MNRHVRRLLAWTCRVLAYLACGAFWFSFPDLSDSWRPSVFVAVGCALWWLSSRIDPSAWRWLAR